MLVVPFYQGKWLFTKHKKRGLEFPGGKGESGESNLFSAQRELLEETGARSDSFIFMADYLVNMRKRCFTKRVYFTIITELIEQADYFETDGPALIAGDVRKLVQGEAFSYFMRDEGMQEILKVCERNKAISAMIKNTEDDQDGNAFRNEYNDSHKRQGSTLKRKLF